MKDKMDDTGYNGDDKDDRNEYDGQPLHRYLYINLSKDLLVSYGSAAES